MFFVFCFIYFSFLISHFSFLTSCFRSGTTDPLPDPGTGLFSWISPVLHFTDEELFTMRGLDSVMYVKFLKYMLILFVMYLKCAFFILIGLNIL